MPGIRKKDQYDSKNVMRDKDFFNKYSIQLIGIGAIFIFLLTLFVYTPALKNDFVNWDDDEYIYENIHIRSLDLKSFQWMLTSFQMGNWHPFTWLSHASVYSLWGLNPRMHHLINIIIHSVNTLLVFFLVIKLMSLWRAKANHTSSGRSEISTLLQDLVVGSTTALLFGLHPLGVESVAWVTERKGLLSAFFMFLSMLSYLNYTSTIHKKHRSIWFGISLLLFVFALTSKPIAITFPLTLLLLDIYPLKRISLSPGKNLSMLLEKIPFFVLSIAFGIITIMAQHSVDAIKNLEQFSLSDRLLNALRSLVFYLEKIVVPLKLVPFYPFPVHTHWVDLQYLLSALLVLFITVFCLWMMKKGKCLPLISWLYYMITLIPVLGIIQVGGHAAADRYTYLPRLSIFLLIGIGVLSVFKKVALLRFKGIFVVLLLGPICIIMLTLSQLTIKQIRIWRNSEILWNYVINVFPKSVAVAHFNLGVAYFDQGKLDEATVEYKRALVIKPDYAEAYDGLGAAYFRFGKVDEAIVEYKRALVIKPDYAEAHDLLGVAYANKGNLREAIIEHKQSLTINPLYAVGFNNLGLAYAKKGNLDEAIISYKKALAINPHLQPTDYNLGLVYYKKGMLDEVISAFKRAVDLNPRYAKAYYSLGLAYYSKGNNKMAVVYFDKTSVLGYMINSELLEILKPYR